MSTIEIKVPDIGDFTDVPVIEIFVKPGDAVKAEDSLVTLESDKATMDVPSPAAGTVKELKVKLGDKVAEGMVILTLEAAEARPHPSPRRGRASGHAPRPRRNRPRASERAVRLHPHLKLSGKRERERIRRAIRHRRRCHSAPSPPARDGGGEERSQRGPERRRGLQGRPRVAVGAQVRARARRRSRARRRHGSEGAHPAGGRAEFRQAGAERNGDRGRGRRHGGRRHRRRRAQPAAVAGGRLREVRSRRRRDRCRASGRSPAPTSPATG